MTTEPLIIETIEKLKAALATRPAPAKSLRVMIKETGTIFASAQTVTDEDLDADTTIIISGQHLRELAARQLNPHMAFLQGKIKIQGDPAHALQWLPLLQWSAPQPQ